MQAEEEDGEAGRRLKLRSVIFGGEALGARLVAGMSGMERAGRNW